MRPQRHPRSLLPLTLLALLGLGASFPSLAGPPETWSAGADLLTAPQGRVGPPASFTLSQESGGLTLRLEYRGRTLTTALPPESSRFMLPLSDHSRLRDPWGSLADLEAGKRLENHGWNIWDGRPATVRAAAPGTVVSTRNDSIYGPAIEIDHGSGIRTRYLLNRYGTGTVETGTRVSAGDGIGELATGLPDDIPFVHFEVLLEAGPGEFVSLDPAPFLLGSSDNRALPFAASVLNAAVRGKDPAKVARLLGLGLDPNARAADGTRPLEWAVMLDNPAMVRLLIAAGGNRHARTADQVGSPWPGMGLTIANTGPSITEFAQEVGDPDLIAAVAGH